MAWILLAGLIACEKGDDGGPGDTDAVTDTDATDTDTTDTETDTTGSETDTPTDSDPTGTPDTSTVDSSGPGVQGVLVGEDGNPLGSYTILCCQSTGVCTFGTTLPDGSFDFITDANVDIAIKTHEDINTDPITGAALEPAQVGVHHVDMGDVFVPSMPGSVKIGGTGSDPQTLAIGDGMTVTFNRADLKADFGVFLDEMGARRIPDAYVPFYPGVGSEAIEGVYAFHPFNTTSTSPIALKVPTTLPAGALVNVRAVSILDGTLLPPVTAHSDGAYVTTDAGQGLTLMTWAVLSAP